MLANLANSYPDGQARSSLIANGLGDATVRPWPMGKKGRQTFKRGSRKLYLGEWLSALSKKPVDLAGAIGVTEPYISQIISGKRPNPGPILLLEISEWLGLTINDLFELPPDRATREVVEGLSASEMAALGRVVNKVKRSGRK